MAIFLPKNDHPSNAIFIIKTTRDAGFAEMQCSINFQEKKQNMSPWLRQIVRFTLNIILFSIFVP